MKRGGKALIYVTGDTHAVIERFSEKYIPGESTWTKDDYLIVCGDFGMIFLDNDEEREKLDELAKKPYTILWADGNHENFKALYQYPVETRWGGKVHRIRDNIFHLMRGQFFEIDGNSIFVMGGAYSPDRYRRQKDYSYWDEELPNNEEYDTAIRNLKEHGMKADYIITHTAPKKIICDMGYYPEIHDAELTGFLEWILYECQFQHWYFGHFHEDKNIEGKNIDDKITALSLKTVVLSES